MDDYYNEDFSEESAIDPNSDLGKLLNLLPDDDRKPNIMNYYYNHKGFLPGISRAVRMLDYFESHKDHTYNVVKTTRAGFTTNCILSALFKNKKILLVAPTNKILYETVTKAYDIYNEVTGDIKKLIRPIPNNKDGCSCVVNKLKNYPQLDYLPFLSSEDCKKCSDEYSSLPLGALRFKFRSSTSKLCILKTMLKEQDVYQDNYAPDILTITYDKLSSIKGNGEKSTLFKELISKSDIIVFDEIGDYLSRSYEGLEFYTESNSNIKNPDYYKNILVSRIPLIRDTSSRNIITHFYDFYITPFFEFLSKHQTGDFPKIINNPLTESHMVEKLNVTPDIKKNILLNKQEILRLKYREYYQTIEGLALDNEPKELITLLLSLLNIMGKKQFMLYEVNTVKYSPKKTKIKSLYISSTKNDLMDTLNEYSFKDKIIIISDATMPVNNLKEYTAKPIKNIFYGDPSNNNKSLLMFHDTTITNFSKSAYFRSTPYRDILFTRILDTLKLDYYGNEVIWTSSKDVASDLSSTLNYLNVPTCTFENPKSDSVMVSYYGSSFTRGVESNRRFQILLGKANKPRDSYKHIAFLRRNEWGFITDKELNILSAKENVPYDDFMDEVKKWNNKVMLDDYIFLDKTIPPNLKEYFNLLSYSVLKEKVYMDSWQAASRVKDPAGEKRSINICIGWNINEVRDIIKWGSNNTITYSLSGKRLIKTQDNLIPIPQVLSSPDLTPIRDWINNKIIKPSHIGFTENIITGIKELVAERSSVTLEEVWLSLCDNNMEFSNTSDKSNNGYLIGAINSAIQYNIEEDIEIIKITPTNYIFNFSPKNPRKTKKYYINKAEFINILEILRAIYLSHETTINFSDIRHFISEKKIPTKLLHELYDIITDPKLDFFNGSTWKVNNGTITKHLSEDIEYNNCYDLIRTRYKNNYPYYELVKYLIEWYYHERTLYEIDADYISSNVPMFINNHELVKNIIIHIQSSDEWAELYRHGLKCDISTPADNIIFTRQNIVY